MDDLTPAEKELALEVALVDYDMIEQVEEHKPEIRFDEFSGEWVCAGHTGGTWRGAVVEWLEHRARGTH